MTPEVFRAGVIEAFRVRDLIGFCAMPLPSHPWVLWTYGSTARH